MTTPPDDFDPPAGQAITLESGLRRILAPNPSPMTYRGTNTYLLGNRGLAVIDPGPTDDSHLGAILAAVAPGQEITHIIVTHSHLDHSPLARRLSLATGAPVLGFGKSGTGRSAIMTELSRSGLAAGQEGLDLDFVPDRTVVDGEMIHGDGWDLHVLHTPGHLGNHIALGWRDACFTADHVMGWASSLVSPPDGDLTDFMASCARLSEQPWRVFHPGHGAPVRNPQQRLSWLIAHRRARESAILDALRTGPATAFDLARRIYTETPASMLPAAERNVLAHLVDLMGKSMVQASSPLSTGSRFSRTDRATG
ncbi:MBL fold metallo-hydrolase [Sedimentitalea sp. JM2-8]|uniref:MBL fold metallo-hydrolase n=1 Tax=Sedimentitalea xiamensis TaxID=3050037 RepID=A0ABT7FCF3_9RHOB|nr:MBL fold metallo-hydrolase [Sedimentitalea xiamensis]MDK3072801.1 MBL fold metallo-hydrolase [Sedimentitalea xiamensis]